MSFLPSSYLVRLHDLKIWQSNYDSVLQNKSGDGTRPSDFETIEGLSALDSTRSSNPENVIDWDKKVVSPSKPFDQLLEEKLAEDKPVPVQVRPKKPFLKKGSGLTRYKLTPRPPGKQAIRRRVPSEKNEGTPERHKDCFRTTVQSNTEPENGPTPLKMPEVVMKPKATWCRVLNDENIQAEVENEARRITDESKVSRINNFNSHILGKINNFALRHFLQSPRKNGSVSSTKPTSAAKRLYENNLSTQKLLENTSEKELRIFEALEERADNSSFSSTNSSIMRLLSSTPNKGNKPSFKRPIMEENIPEKENNLEIATPAYFDGHCLNLAQKLEEVNKKSDVLHDFLNNLRKISNDKNVNERISESNGSSVGENRNQPADRSFSDEEKSSTNTDTRSQSPSSFYTDFENTFKGAVCTKTDAAVNTSFEEKEASTQMGECLNCRELRKNLDKLSKEVPDIQAEKAKVCDFAKDLEKKRDQLNRELQKQKKKYDEDIADLKEELDAEKKKFFKEKTVFDMYIKESQNRPNKKEREEITNLKRELVDVKELLKLKDTKNGATQARLRNQIKQLEKEKAELKNTVDALQKENAKLNATQKVRRPSEVKMLHEINKNLTKLAEETFRKQTTKSDTSNNASQMEDTKKKPRKNSWQDDQNIEGEVSPKVKKKNSSLKKRLSQDNSAHNSSNENGTNDTTHFTNISLEQQYESVFGQYPSPRQRNNSLNESKKEKTETVFGDGSKEIKYSNGNSKTISPDGNLVIVQYYNGDIKETNLTQNTLKYYYAENGTWHTQFKDGSELFEYPSGQKEKKYKDGKKEVTCPDGSVMMRFSDGSEEILYPDGSKIIKNSEGEKTIMLPNGQKEVHTKDHKRREYPDGTVKILYPDGMQETRYASGRIRIKDSMGALILDSHM